MIDFTPDEIEALEEIVREAFQDALATGGEYGSKNHTGDLSNSFRLVWNESDQQFDITFEQYGLNFNNPRPGTWPNVDKLRKWVVDKGLIEADKKQYEINSVAFLVGRKIFNEGVDYFDLLGPIFDKLLEMSQFISESQAEKIQFSILNRIQGTL